MNLFLLSLLSLLSFASQNCLTPALFSDDADVDDYASVQAMFDEAAEAGGSCVCFEAGRVYEYSGGTIRIDADDLTIYAYGSIHNNVTMYFTQRSSQATWLGGRIVWSPSQRQALSVYAHHLTVRDLHIFQAPTASANPPIYIRHKARFCVFDNVSSEGGVGWEIHGEGHRISGCTIRQTLDRDDGFVLKAPNGDTKDIVISDCRVYGAADAFAVGSQVGVGQEIRDVTVSNLLAYDTNRLAHIKPGNSWKGVGGGVVKNITITNSQLRSVGENFRTGISISSGDGSVIRGVYIDNALITGKMPQLVSGNYSGIFLGVSQGGALKDVRIERVLIEGEGVGLDHLIWIRTLDNAVNVRISNITGVSAGPVRDDVGNPGLVLSDIVER